MLKPAPCVFFQSISSGARAEQPTKREHCVAQHAPAHEVLLVAVHPAALVIALAAGGRTAGAASVFGGGEFHSGDGGVTQDKCISRESSPGHIDGDDVFYH